MNFEKNYAVSEQRFVVGRDNLFCSTRNALQKA